MGHPEARTILIESVLAGFSNEPLVFKGGTYLSLFHGLKRRTSDLDFTALRPPSPSLAPVLSHALADAGLPNSVQSGLDNAFAISFVLQVAFAGVRFSLEIDISKQEQILAPARVLYPFRWGGFFPALSGMALEEVAAEKVHALIARYRRERLKPTDVSDLVFLLRQKYVPCNHSLVERKCAIVGGFHPEELRRAVATTFRLFGDVAGSIDPPLSCSSVQDHVASWLRVRSG